jgi:hypothetical protein
MTQAPIIINAVNGTTVAAGPADIIRAALRGAHPLTISGKHAPGDVVYLAPRIENVWRDDAVTVESTDIARTIQHPQHGEVLYAWVDMDRLDAAPQVVELARARRARMATEAAAAEARGAAMVPACDNCGDCRLCV